MKTKLWLILSVILMSGKCSDDKKIVQEKPDLLLVIAIDVSSTMDKYGNVSFTKEQLEKTCTTLLNRNSNVSICIKFIGNPSGGFDRLVLNKVPQINVEDNLSSRANERKNAEKVKAENLANIQQFMGTLPMDRKNESKTCLNECFSDINILLSEPQYTNYQKFVCIYSDGYQDVNGDNVVEPVMARFSEDIHLLTVGWKNTDKIKHEGVNNEFVDIQGFESYISTLITK